jgi:hypothetical protein
MACITLEIDDAVLSEIRKLAATRNQAFGSVISQLLVEAVTARVLAVEAHPLVWYSQAMGVGVDISDMDALFSVLDQEA